MQTTVNIKQAFGIVGELYDNVPTVSNAFLLKAAAAIGKVAFMKADGTVSGTYDSTNYKTIAGLFVRPKDYASFGSSSGTLSPTLEIPAGQLAQVLSVGRVNVKVMNAAAINDNAYVCTVAAADGSVTIGDVVAGASAAPTVAGATFVQITGAKFVLVSAASGELAVLQLGL